MNDFIKILIADTQEMSRDIMAAPLRERGYAVFQAEDGQSALDIIEREDIHLAILQSQLTLIDGLEIVKRLMLAKHTLPVILVTESTSSDFLMQAVSLGVDKVLQKPVPPNRLMTAVERIINKLGLSVDAMFVESYDVTGTPEDLMSKAIELAQTNARSGSGRPFGAIVADREGHILGQGTNGIASRADPSAHAEVVAIRQAANALGRADLSDCVLYCSAAPSKIGLALIESVAITDVYYALSHEDVAKIREENTQRHAAPVIKQMSQAVAQERLGAYLK